MSSRQRLFESDSDYRDRMNREADESRIERYSGDSPSQRLFESDEDYEERISRESDEDTIEEYTDSKPSQRLFESDDDYEERIELEANERTIEDATGDSPSQRLFESDSDYHNRIEREADEAIIERETGNAPSQRLFESDSDYEERISREADELDSEDSSNSSGCFLTTACIESAGLPDNCHELTVLRQFRDTMLNQNEKGRNLIKQYYNEAPRLVIEIKNSPNKDTILNSILRDVRQTVFFIETCDHKLAIVTYQGLFNRLMNEFPSNSTDKTSWTE